MYALLQLGYEDSKYEEYSNLYFRIPAEFEATKWAVEYYKNHIQHCEHFLDELFMRQTASLRSFKFENFLKF